MTNNETRTIEIKKQFDKWKKNKRSILGDRTITELEREAYIHLEWDYIDVNDGDYEVAYYTWQMIKKFC